MTEDEKYTEKVYEGTSELKQETLERGVMSGSCVIEKDWTYKGFPCVVIATYMGHRCAYVDVTGTSFEKYANYESYDDAPLNVHGGVTFGGDSIGSKEEARYGNFIGWDYAHCGDASIPLEEICEIFKDYPKTVELIKSNDQHGCYGNPFGEWENSLENVMKDTEEVVDQIAEREQMRSNAKEHNIKERDDER